jgi:hypothetical protein
MSPRIALISLALLSQTGCVAALPMVAQMVTDPHSTERLCSMTKMPGQTVSFCDRLHFAPEAQPLAKAPAGAVVNTAAR